MAGTCLQASVEGRGRSCCNSCYGRIAWHGIPGIAVTWQLSGCHAILPYIALHLCHYLQVPSNASNTCYGLFGTIRPSIAWHCLALALYFATTSKCPSASFTYFPANAIYRQVIDWALGHFDTTGTTLDLASRVGNGAVVQLAASEVADT